MELRDRYTEFKRENPRVRIRDAASRLGVSEAQLVATGCGDTAVRLEGDWKALLSELHRLGRVMVLTRNEAAVHERHGEYVGARFMHGGAIGLLPGPEVDLRLFMRSWSAGFAVTTESPRGALRSFQFFDAQGSAVHKVYLRQPEKLPEWEALVQRWRSEDQSRVQVVKPAADKAAETPDAEIDAEGLREAWRGLRDTHDFHPMLRRFSVSRLQAFRLMGPEWATPVPTDRVQTLLEAASSLEQPIMVFVGNPGCIQIHTGPVENIKVLDAWLNVLDPDFNLHLNTDHVHSAWVVRKPTADGQVTSLEIYNEAGENIALFFGARKPGVPEDEGWRLLVEGLCPGR